MTDPLCAHTLAGLLFLAILLAVAFIFWPMLVITFEAGLLVGIFLHSAHNAAADQPLPGEQDQNF
jgi:hypothetical protein